MLHGRRCGACSTSVRCDAPKSHQPEREPGCLLVTILERICLRNAMAGLCRTYRRCTECLGLCTSYSQLLKSMCPRLWSKPRKNVANATTLYLYLEQEQWNTRWLSLCFWCKSNIKKCISCEGNWCESRDNIVVIVYRGREEQAEGIHVLVSHPRILTNRNSASAKWPPEPGSVKADLFIWIVKHFERMRNKEGWIAICDRALLYLSAWVWNAL